MSVDSAYLNEFATKLQTDIGKVVINDTIEISTFSTEEVTDNVYELIFNILASQTTQIDSIKLKKLDDTLLFSDPVDIPVTEDEVVIRHVITISEVIS